MLPGVLVKGVQLGHAVRRLQVFGAQDHDDQIGLAQRLHEGGNQVAVPERGLVANHVPMLLFQRSAQPSDHFLALAVFFRGDGCERLGVVRFWRLLAELLAEVEDLE